MKPIYRHIIIGFIVGFLAMPLWVFIVANGMNAQGIDPSTIAPLQKPLWVNMFIGGGIGIFAVISIYDFPKWHLFRKDKRVGG